MAPNGHSRWQPGRIGTLRAANQFAGAVPKIEAFEVERDQQSPARRASPHLALDEHEARRVFDERAVG